MGACLVHVMFNGDEHPIAYVLHASTSSESNYGQIEREALAIVFGVRQFYQYLYGRSFTHHTLCKILGEKEGIPPLVAAALGTVTKCLLLFNSTHFG